MIVLAIDCSSPVGGVALTRGDVLLGTREWDGDGRSRQQLFLHLEGLLRETGVAVADIGLFAAGRGPGNFSGLRSSMAAAQAMAMPGGRPVVALSSGRLVAAAAFARDPALQRVKVIGDARRGTLWHADFFRPAEGGVVAAAEWRLATADELPASVAPGTLCVSSDAPRIREVYPRLAGLLLTGDALLPSVALLAGMARQERELGLPPEPFEPVYMHPAVLSPARDPSNEPGKRVNMTIIV